MYDAGIGLVRFGARDYDPRTGRWVQKDPSGFAGRTHFYDWVASDPVNYIDVDGRNPMVIGAVIWGASGFLASVGTQMAAGTSFGCVDFGAALLQGAEWAMNGALMGQVTGAFLSANAARAAASAAARAGAAGRGAGAASRVAQISERNLQKGFTKHGADFGLSGNWNPSRGADFSRAVNTHINSPTVVDIAGTYRGAPVTHIYNPATGLNVMLDSKGAYVGGWRLGGGQLETLLRYGGVQ